MIIKIDAQSEIPLYTQLMQAIKEGIATKKLLPGDSLPSVRVLAGDLGINLHTVNKAYQLLKQQGYIQIHRQKGVIIHPEGSPQVDEIFMEQLRQDLQPLVTEAVCRKMDEQQFIKMCQALFQQLQSKDGE